MSDPLSMIADVVGLVATSANIASIAKMLYGSGKDAPASMRRIGEEMDQLQIIVGQAQMLLEGLSSSQLTILPLYHPMIILRDCDLACSSLDEKLRKVAGAGFGARVQWALWREAEALVILADLERHKLSLHMMLTIDQCNLNEQLVNLHSSGRTPLSVRHDILPLLDPGAAVDAAGSGGRTLLSQCAELGYISSCKLLLDRGAQVDTRDPSGRTPLWYSVHSGGEDICELLLDRGAAVDAADSSGSTPLSHCTDSSVCRLLLDRGAQVGTRDPSGRTPLWYSVHFGREDICELLLDRGAAVDAADSSGRTPLSHCTSASMCQLLLDQGAAIDADSSGRTPLSHCAELGVVSVCRSLLERGAAVNAAVFDAADTSAVDSDGRTLLSHCAELGSVSACRLLLGRGAVADAADSSGHTPLWYAHRHGETSRIYRLLLGVSLAERANLP